MQTLLTYKKTAQKGFDMIDPFGAFDCTKSTDQRRPKAQSSPGPGKGVGIGTPCSSGLAKS